MQRFIYDIIKLENIASQRTVNAPDGDVMRDHVRGRTGDNETGLPDSQGATVHLRRHRTQSNQQELCTARGRHGQEVAKGAGQAGGSRLSWLVMNDGRGRR